MAVESTQVCDDLHSPCVMAQCLYYYLLGQAKKRHQNPNLCLFNNLPGSTFQTFHSMDADSPDYHSHALDKDNTAGHNTCVNFNYIVYITCAYCGLLSNDSFGPTTKAQRHQRRKEQKRYRGCHGYYLLLNIELTISFLIGRKRRVNFQNQRL